MLFNKWLKKVIKADDIYFYSDFPYSLHVCFIIKSNSITLGAQYLIYRSKFANEEDAFYGCKLWH